MVEYQKLSSSVASTNNVAIVAPQSFKRHNRITCHLQRGNRSAEL